MSKAKQARPHRPAQEQAEPLPPAGDAASPVARQIAAIERVFQAGHDEPAHRERRPRYPIEVLIIGAILAVSYANAALHLIN